MLLLSLATQESHDTTDSESLGGRLFASERRDNLGEIQLAHQAGRLYLRAGLGFLAGKEEVDNQGTADSHKQRSRNAYLYATLVDLPGGLRIDGGFSRDYIADPSLTKPLAQNNYKAGMAWDVSPDTTLRLAAFRVLKRTGLAELTIEPTQMTGFNQFFDDFNGTSARRSAVALTTSFQGRCLPGWS